MKLRILAFVFLVCNAAAAAPNIVNGSIESAATLARAESEAGTGWIGYAIPTAKPVFISCCGGDNITVRGDEGDLRPAGSSTVDLFVRYDAGRIDKVRVYSPACTLDAGGGRVLWVDNVPPAESIAYLERIVDRGERRGVNGAMLALSLHAGGTEPLIRIAHHNADPHARGTALFWLSQQAGERAAAALRDAVDNDPEESVRGKAVFGISQLPDDQSIPMLIDLLKNNRSREVRRKAAFWLGQKRDPRALEAIVDILRR